MEKRKEGLEVNMLDLPDKLRDEIQAAIQPTNVELYLMLNDLINAISSNDGQAVAQSSYRNGLGIAVVNFDLAEKFKNHDNLLMKRVSTLSGEMLTGLMLKTLADTGDLTFGERIEALHLAMRASFEARQRAESNVEFD